MAIAGAKQVLAAAKARPVVGLTATPERNGSHQPNILVSYIRVGSTNEQAGASPIEDLKRLHRRDSFDEQAMPSLNPPLVWKTRRVTAAFGSQSSTRQSPQGRLQCQ